MSDTHEKHPTSNQPEKRSTSADNDETRPSRRVTHPDRTRLSVPATSPSKETPPAEEQPPKKEPSTPALPDPALTRPTRPVPRQPRPAFTRRRPGEQPTTRQQPPVERNPPSRRRVHYQNPLGEQQTRHAPPPPAAPQAQSQATAPPPQRRGWLGRSFAVIVFLSIILGAVLLAGGVITYFWIASQLPPAEALRARSLQFATTKILDREGNLLWEIIDPTGGRRTQVPLDQISLDLINATVATEDRFFYANVGVDPIAIGRAIYYNVSEGEIVSGASTITQQLARNVLLTPQERTQQSLSRKVREAILAVEINRQYTKEDILDVYLNQIYYGNLAYGIEAASQTYFGKRARDLTLAEASMLAGLPQSPAIHDPYTNPEGAKARQADVLRLMVEANYLTAAEAKAAQNELLDFRDLNFAFEAPHFVSFVRQELERNVPPDYIYQAGLRVQTTLDPRLQTIAEMEVRDQVNALAARRATNGALVAIEVASGEILALVGSKDFRDEAIDGQINMVVSPRQPGSSIKPLTYLAAFETLNWTPSSLIMDTMVEYPDGAGGVYQPKNYDDKFHGPVSVRQALANSYNIPPVKALALMGVDALKEMSARLGIKSLTRNDYGLALTLGGGEVSVLEMTGAYQTIANQGLFVPPTSILKITDNFGRVIEPQRPQPRRVLRKEHAYLMSHILADNEARTPAFGPNSALNLSRPAAAKTGTTNDFRDSWIVGYTPDIVTGVWVGNADNTPMSEVGGSNGAGPIWHNFMERAHEGRPVRDFVRPPTIIELEVCADSGTIPSEVCPQRRTEIFFKDQPPLDVAYDIHQLISIDLKTGLRANEFCSTQVEERYYRVYPPDGVEWAISQGFDQPPIDFCPSANIVANIATPLDGSTARNTISLEGSASADNFSHYQIEMGTGTNPDVFVTIAGPVNQMVSLGILGVFDTTAIDNGAYTVRLVVSDRTGGQGEARIRLLVDNVPTPVSTATPTATATPSVTSTPTPTATENPPTLTPTATLEPTTEPTLEPTTEPTIEPTVEPTIEPTLEPTTEPTIEPTTEPTAEPTSEPRPEPTPEPVLEPTTEPTPEPTAEPTSQS